MSPVEAHVTKIKNFDRWKSSLVAWSLHSEALDRYIILRKRCNYDVIIDHTLNEELISKIFGGVLFQNPPSKNSGYGPAYGFG